MGMKLPSPGTGLSFFLLLLLLFHFIFLKFLLLISIINALKTNSPEDAMASLEAGIAVEAKE